MSSSRISTACWEKTATGSSASLRPIVSKTTCNPFVKNLQLYRELVLVNRIGDPLVTSSPEDPLVNLLPPTPAVYTSFRNQPVVGLGKTLPVRHH